MRISTFSQEERRERKNEREKLRREKATPAARLQERERSKQRRQAQASTAESGRVSPLSNAAASSSKSAMPPLNMESTSNSPSFHHGLSTHFTSYFS
ncbi:hypothetical protein DL93DRAFT_2091551 [Clavulina sp. PMI_390]|nr:hypothetical protein DL93DRAFT_2091551 [Clavulina sp. PMI_390]